MSIIKFINAHIDTIKDKLERHKKNDKLKFTLVYKTQNEVLNFSYKGGGTYGHVLKVTNNTKNTSDIPIGQSLTLKIMKSRTDEPYKIKELRSVINAFNNKHIIDKYIINIYYVDLKEDLIFLEYLEGNTIDHYLKNNTISNEHLNMYILKTLLCIKVFHNILKYSHRDLKEKNIIYNPETGIMKCIDYGFICKLRDKKCRNRYQGTGKYIHPDMNKKYATKKYNSMSLSLPDSISQDLFSIIIMLLKIYINSKTQSEKSSSRSINTQSNNSEEENLKELIDNYERQIYKSKYNNKKSGRYRGKYILFNKLLKINEENITNNIIRETIKIIRLHWDFKMNNFCIEGKKNILITNFIFDSLIFNAFKCIQDSPEKKDLYFDWSIIYSYNLNI